MLCELLFKKASPPTPTISCDNSLANVGINYFVVLIIYCLVSTWGCYGSFLSIGRGSLFSILLSCRIMNMAYCIAMTLISSNVYMMLSLGILDGVSRLSIKGVCVDARAPTVMSNSGSTFHSLLIILSISGLYFLFFLL